MVDIEGGNVILKYFELLKYTGNVLCSNSRVVIGREPNDNIHSLSAPHKDGAISAPWS